MLRRINRHHNFMSRYSKELLLGFLSRPAFIYLVFLSMTSILIFSSIFYFIEMDLNPHMDNFLDVIYFVVASMTTVGYGDIVAVTTAGKIIAIFMMLLSSLIFVSFTAIIASLLLEIELKMAEKKD